MSRHIPLGMLSGRDPLLTDLVAWYKYEESSGTRVNAHTPGTHDATATGTVGSTTGKRGNAVFFDTTGTNRRLTVANHANLVMGDTPFTIAGWVHFLTGGDTSELIIQKGIAGAAGGEWGLSRTNSTNSLNFIVRNAADSASVTASVTVSDSAWHYIVAQHDPDTNLISIELNRGTPVTTALSGGSFTGSNAVNMGAHSAGAEFRGYQDELTIYRRLLTTNDKDRLYNGSAGMTYPG
jgi:hypothetical protein